MDLPGLLVGFVAVVALGTGTGLLTGLSPGLHVNNVAALVLTSRTAWTTLLAILAPTSLADGSVELLLACYLLAVAASHAIFDFVPSVFFGAPSEETALSVLPGHRLLLEGEGVRAVGLAARGALLGTAFAAALVLPLRWLLAEPIGLGEAFRPWTAVFLAGLLVALLVSEARWARGPVRRVLRAAWVQLLAGLLGLAVLRGPALLDETAILFPLFSGLFGAPNLVLGLRARPGSIPEQRTGALPALSRSDAIQALRGACAGAAVSWLPGLSGGAAATLASIGTRRKLAATAFMVVLGAVSTTTAILSVAVLFILGKTRSGTAAAVQDLVGSGVAWSGGVSPPGALLLLLLAAVLASIAAAPAALAVAKVLAPRWSAIDPRKLSAAILAGLGVLILIATGPIGLAVAGVSVLVGLVPVVLGVRRVHLMASLLVPAFLGSVTV